MNSWGLRGHLTRARDGHKQIHRQEQCTLWLFFPVVGREMTAGGSTQIFALCWAPFIQCSHPYCILSLSLLLSFIFQMNPLCPSQEAWIGQIWSHTASLSQLWEHQDQVVCFSYHDITEVDAPPPLPALTVPMHSWLQLLGIKSC